MPLSAKVEPSVDKKVEKILSGEWTIDDAIEMQVDEISTAGSVGSGPDQTLGTVRRTDEYEHLKKAYEEYLAKTDKEDSNKAVKEFFENFAPGYNKSAIKGFSRRMGLRKR